MLELNKIYAEDCLVTLKRMSDESIDLVLTSPPYDNLRSYEGYSFDFNNIAAEIARVIKPSGVIVWVVGDQTVKGSESGTSFRQALKFMDLGLKLHDTMIYQKNSSTYCARPDSKRYTQIFEYMFVITKDKPKARLICDKRNKWYGHKDWSGKMKNPVREFSPRTNIWRYVTSFNGWKHPAPFPEQLAIDHVISWTDEGDVVYDPFMGSGTTAVAALKTNRNFIGSEISSNYVAMSNERISQIVDNSSL
jgi:site-specific DNA-methyltransferase (adenine-specific)